MGGKLPQKDSSKDKIDPAFDKIIKFYIQFVEVVGLPTNTGWLVIEEKALNLWEKKEGDIGAVVHCYADGNIFEVEFVTAGGRTIAVLTLSLDDIRLISSTEILHVREVARQAA